MDRILSASACLENEVLIAPEDLGKLTVADVVKARNKEEHIQLACLWNQSAWHAWATYHDKVEEWYKMYQK